MTDDVEPPPDRSPTGRRPVRVARFDGFPPAGGEPPSGRRVAAFDGPPAHDGDAGPAGSAGSAGPAPDGLAELATPDGSAPPDPAVRPPTRVARFDAFDAGPTRAPVARLDVDDPTIADLAAARRRRARRSATPPGTDPERAAPDTDGRGRRRSGGRTGAGGAAGASRVAGADGAAGAGATDATGAIGAAGAARPPDAPSDAAGAGPDDLPPDGPLRPDGPLPRGRRRRARVGRLGPDAPDPEEPQPDPAADPAAIAREICLRLLTDRARTRQELAQALARKGVPADAAATVLDRFDEVGLIDDAAFAGQWVRSRHTHRGLGRRAIAVELRRKGVADDVAGEALAEVDGAAEARRARELVDRKLRSLPLDTPDRRASAGRRLVGMLARKGYGPGTAYAVVRDALADHGAAADELDGADSPDD